MQNPPTHTGLRHLALQVIQLEACVIFYTDVMGMQIEWQPDPDNVYLTSGIENLALHRLQGDFSEHNMQRLDHLGFILKTADDVDAWYEFLLKKNVEIKAKPKVHRDGSKSLYCADPDGNIVQMIYHPPIAIPNNYLSS